jgi:hypothetical protein
MGVLMESISKFSGRCLLAMLFSLFFVTEICSAFCIYNFTGDADVNVLPSGKAKALRIPPGESVCWDWIKSECSPEQPIVDDTISKILICRPGSCMENGECSSLLNQLQVYTQISGHRIDGINIVKEEGEYMLIYRSKRIQDELVTFKEDFALFQKDNLWGYIMWGGSFAIPPQFDEARPFSEGLAPVRKQNFWGCIDKKGQIIIDYTFQDIQGFSGGLAPAKRDGKWGFINKEGNFMLPQSYRGAGMFSKGLAPVKTYKNKWGYINPKGTFVIPAQFDDARPFAEGLGAIKDKCKWGYINPQGKIVVSPRYDDVKSFSSHLAAVELGGKWGYINDHGILMIPLTLTFADNFGTDTALVEKDGAVLTIDKKGRIISNIAPGQLRILRNPGVVDMKGMHVLIGK